MTDIDEKIAQANQRLKAARIRVSIERRGDCAERSAPWAIACYGLRSHEVFRLDLEDFPVVRVTQGKTGARFVYPLYPEWAQRWELHKRMRCLCREIRRRCNRLRSFGGGSLGYLSEWDGNSAIARPAGRLHQFRLIRPIGTLQRVLMHE